MQAIKMSESAQNVSRSITLYNLSIDHYHHVQNGQETDAATLLEQIRTIIEYDPDILAIVVTFDELKESISSKEDVWNQHTTTLKYSLLEFFSYETTLPLHFVARMGNTQLVTLFLSQYPRAINIGTTDNNYLPLHCAAESGSSTCLQLILDAGKDAIAIEDAEGCLPIFMATRSGHIECIKIIINAYPEGVTHKDNYDELPLHKAALKGSYACITTLLGAECKGAFEGASKRSAVSGNYPIHYAAQSGCIKCVKLLLSIHEDGASIRNGKDGDDKLPLHIAAKNGHSECVSIIVNAYPHGACAKDASGNYSIVYAGEFCSNRWKIPP